ncbi:galactokinase [Paenibacillus aurantius]|uniref:Galactokinase n=1 Tax=Paenibacillus aurantius TaxID=2918900 RepID=A0AA96L9Y5_9BACL|nr:galactokinase [Paenibacillus aurantius]WNQ09741.1 galactokinase [Paenibacillus aurantius]
MADLSVLKNKFVERYGGSEEGIRVFFAPGRVNLIGEHTDYNGGYVFPAALTFGTTMLLRKREDQTIRFASENFPVSGDVHLAQAKNVKEDDWINYPKAVLVHLGKRGYTFGGYDVLYLGEIPNGAGLSSSASIQLVTAFGFMTMENHKIDKVELALVAQESENQFMGVNCGIMDQFTVAMGEKDHAVLLKCNTLEYEQVPFESQGYKIVIGNTNKRRGLVDSEYNARRSQCEQAVGYLKAKFPDLTLLGELTLEQFEANESLIPDETVRKRARHVIEENDRVLRSVEALKKRDLEEFGRLMIASHNSLRDLYEVTCRELDVMVEEALKAEGVLGSRMTGAGFGGCTVSLVHGDHVQGFIEQVGKAYADRTDFQGDFYVGEIGNGVMELTR